MGFRSSLKSHFMSFRSSLKSHFKSFRSSLKSHLLRVILYHPPTQNSKVKTHWHFTVTVKTCLILGSILQYFCGSDKLWDERCLGESGENVPDGWESNQLKDWWFQACGRKRGTKDVRIQVRHHGGLGSIWISTEPTPCSNTQQVPPHPNPICQPGLEFDDAAWLTVPGLS